MPTKMSPEPTTKEIESDGLRELKIAIVQQSYGGHNQSLGTKTHSQQDKQNKRRQKPLRSSNEGVERHAKKFNEEKDTNAH